MNIYFSTIRSLVVLALVLSSLSAKAQGFVSLDPQISSNDITVGDDFCVDFELLNIELLSSIQFSLVYDDALLSFSSFSSPVLPGFTDSNFNLISEGFIAVSYDPSISDYPNGLSIDSEVFVFQVCFEALAETEMTSISITDEPVVFEVTSNGTLRKVQGSSVSFDIMAEDIDCPFDGIKLEIEETCGSSGYNVCIDVFADDFEGVLSKQYSIMYDPSVLAFTNAGDFILPNLFTENIANPFPGFITVSWFSDDLIDGTSLDGKQKIYELCFDVIEEGTGSSSTYLSIGSTPAPMEAISNSLDEMDIWRVDGKLDINIPDCDNNGDPIGPLSFNISDYEVVSGSNICIPITVSGFSTINSFQYSINYDPLLLEFTSTNFVGFPGFTSSNINNVSPGAIGLSWDTSDPSNGTTVLDNTVLVELCFDVIGSAGSTAVEFTCSPVPIEILNNMFEFVFADFNTGSVSIIGQGPEGFTLELSDTSGELGDVVCVDVTTSNFDNILGMQFSIDYDSTALNYVGVEGINLPDFFDSNVGNPSAGVLTLSWFSASDLVNGASVPDGTAIFQICFDVIGDVGVYPIEFTGKPSPIEVIDALTLTPINPVNLVGGEVEIEEIEIGTGDLELDISTETAQNGENVCLDVTASNFENVLAMQFSIDYDEIALNYTGVEGINLADLTVASIINLSPGALSFSWFSNSDLINGATVPDGTAIFQICFEVIADDGVYPVEFRNSPTPIEFVDAITFSVINPVNLDDGGVNIVSFFNSDMDLNVDANSTNILYQNKPNPASESTTVSFDLSEAGIVKFDLFKENGVLVKSFSNEYEAGITEIQLNDLKEPGLYYYTISGQGFSLGKRMIVVSE